MHTEPGNATVGSGKWRAASGERHGDEDDNDAGYEISLLPLNDKGIYAEVIFLNLDRPRDGVPIAA